MIIKIFCTLLLLLEIAVLQYNMPLSLPEMVVPLFIMACGLFYIWVFT